MADELEKRIEENKEAIVRLQERQEAGFEVNDQFHHKLEKKVEVIHSKVDSIAIDVSAYRWLAKGVMLTLLFIGSVIGWIIHEWHIIKGWFGTS